MTKKRLVGLFLVVSYAAVSFFTGCVPEDSLHWSRDGSVGIYSKGGSLFLVNGNTGSLTQVEPNESTTPWPAISPDGLFFAYSKAVKVDDFKKALHRFRPDRVELIKKHADILKRKVLAKDVVLDELPAIGTLKAGRYFSAEEKDDFNSQHVAWVQRYLVENADSQLAEKISPELIKKTKEEELVFYQVVAAPTADPNNRKVLASGSQMLWHIRFSPDSTFVVWMENCISKDMFEAGFNLYVARCDGQTPPVLVESAVAIGCDFRSDSRAIAYLRADNKDFDTGGLVVGTLVEQTIVDANGKLLAKAVDANYYDSGRSCIWTGPSEDLASVVYQSWMSVSYGLGDRIFFSSPKILLPARNIDEEQPIIFCCDKVTGSISEILPRGAAEFAEASCHIFDLSHDSREVLLAGSYNSVGIYTMGGDLEMSKVLVEEDESFGDSSLPGIAPQWKGADRISCLVGEDSRFIRVDPNTPHRRKEIVILDTDGNLKQILSKDWPDELLDF